MNVILFFPFYLWDFDKDQIDTLVNCLESYEVNYWNYAKIDCKSFHNLTT